MKKRQSNAGINVVETIAGGFEVFESFHLRLIVVLKYLSYVNRGKSFLNRLFIVANRHELSECSLCKAFEFTTIDILDAAHGG